MSVALGVFCFCYGVLVLFKFAHRLSLPSSGVEVILSYVIARVSLLVGLSVTLLVAGSCCGFFLAMILGSVIFSMGGWK